MLGNSALAAPVQAEHAQPDPVQVRSITVRPGRLSCLVVVPDERHRFTTPKLAAFVQGCYPELVHHACVNGVGPTFGAVMEHTSTPHLLEHLAISLQARAAGAHGDGARIGAHGEACEAVRSGLGDDVLDTGPHVEVRGGGQRAAACGGAHSAGPHAAFVGTSEWTVPERGEARVELSFRDDLEALRAFSEATRFLNIAVLTCLP